MMLKSNICCPYGKLRYSSKVFFVQMIYYDEQMIIKSNSRPYGELLCASEVFILPRIIMMFRLNTCFHMMD